MEPQAGNEQRVLLFIIHLFLLYYITN